MDKIEFITGSGRLEIDKAGRVQTGNGSNYVSVRLTQLDIARLITFLQNIRIERG